MNKLITIAAAALLALVAGCGTVETKTGSGVGTEVNPGTGYANVKLITVKHGECEFIVTSVQNAAEATRTMHSPTCPNPAHQR